MLILAKKGDFMSKCREQIAPRGGGKVAADEKDVKNGQPTHHDLRVVEHQKKRSTDTY